MSSEQGQELHQSRDECIIRAGTRALSEKGREGLPDKAPPLQGAHPMSSRGSAPSPSLRRPPSRSVVPLRGMRVNVWSVLSLCIELSTLLKKFPSNHVLFALGRFISCFALP